MRDSKQADTHRCSTKHKGAGQLVESHCNSLFWSVAGVFARQRVGWPSATPCITSPAKPWSQGPLLSVFCHRIRSLHRPRFVVASCVWLILSIGPSRSAGSLFSQKLWGNCFDAGVRGTQGSYGFVELMSMLSPLTSDAKMEPGADGRRLCSSLRLRRGNRQVTPWLLCHYARSPSGRLVRGSASCA